MSFKHRILCQLLKGYVEAGALDGDHESLYREYCQLNEVKKEGVSNPTDWRVLYPQQWITIQYIDTAWYRYIAPRMHHYMQHY